MGRRPGHWSHSDAFDLVVLNNSQLIKITAVVSALEFHPPLGYRRWPYDHPENLQ